MHKMNKLFQVGAVSVGLLASGWALANETRPMAPRAKAKATEGVNTVRENVKEAVLNSKIRMALFKSLKGADALRVEVTVRGTTAMLSGEVEDRASEKVAAEAAKAVEGITAVKSEITHNPKAANQENLETRLKDGMLANQVRLRLLEDLGATTVDIHVTATDGVVTLRGTTPNAAARERAVEKIKDMPEVKRVEDMMSTTP